MGSCGSKLTPPQQLSQQLDSLSGEMWRYHENGEALYKSCEEVVAAMAACARDSASVLSADASRAGPKAQEKLHRLQQTMGRGWALLCEVASRAYRVDGEGFRRRSGLPRGVSDRELSGPLLAEQVMRFAPARPTPAWSPPAQVPPLEEAPTLWTKPASEKV